MTNGKPRRVKGRGKPPPPKTPEEQRAHMEWAYLSNQDADIRIHDARRMEDVRMRADGSPSAVRPQAVLPLRHWAVIESLPDGEEYEDVHDRLYGYVQWLKVLKRNGLYDGPTRLTIDNPQSREDADAEADRGT